MFSSASQAEIIRSNQKDDYYTGIIKGNTSDIAQQILGPRQWIRWHKELDCLADLGYFFITTLRGLQTLGEEYVTNIQVNSTKRAIPSVLSRGFMIMMQIAIPYGIDKSLLYLESILQQDLNIGISVEHKAQLLKTIPVLRNVITILHRFHLAIFYWNGSFYHIAKRLSGIHYIRVRQSMASISNISSYKILGSLCFLQLSFTFLQHLSRFLKAQRQLHADDNFLYDEDNQLTNEEHREHYDEKMSMQSKCSLCLEPREHPTATPCGHLFCWNCIHEWSHSKTICPLCREKFELSRLIFLHNYF